MKPIVREALSAMTRDISRKKDKLCDKAAARPRTMRQIDLYTRRLAEISQALSES